MVECFQGFWGEGDGAFWDLYDLFSVKVSLSQLQPFRDKKVYVLFLSSLSWRSEMRLVSSTFNKVRSI